MRTFAASLVVLIIGLGTIFVATNRGQAFTTETLRRSEVDLEARQIPDFPIRDSVGRETTLRNFLAADRRIWIVDFVYTRCQTVCSSLGSIYQQLQRQIEARRVQGRVGLLSISFDPAKDDALALRNYRARMSLNPAVWDIVTLTSAGDRRRLLDSFGIMVVPAAFGEFEHNAALHVVDSKGRLVRIMDYDAAAEALEFALTLAK